MGNKFTTKPRKTHEFYKNKHLFTHLIIMEQSSTDYSDDESGASYIESTDDEDYISDSYSNQFYKNNSNTNITSTYSNNRDTEKLVKVKNPHRAYNKASDLASMRSKTSFVSIRKSLISNYE